MPKLIGNDTRQTILDLAADGLSQREIARRLGVSQGFVSHYLKSIGYPLPGHGGLKRTVDYQEVLKAFEEGATKSEIMAWFGLSRSSVNSIIRTAKEERDRERST